MPWWSSDSSEDENKDTKAGGTEHGSPRMSRKKDPPKTARMRRPRGWVEQELDKDDPDPEGPPDHGWP